MIEAGRAPLHHSVDSVLSVDGVLSADSVLLVTDDVVGSLSMVPSLHVAFVALHEGSLRGSHTNVAPNRLPVAHGRN
jgi:hypothetical protein